MASWSMMAGCTWAELARVPWAGSRLARLRGCGRGGAGAGHEGVVRRRGRGFRGRRRGFFFTMAILASWSVVSAQTVSAQSYETFGGARSLLTPQGARWSGAELRAAALAECRGLGGHTSIRLTDVRFVGQTIHFKCEGIPHTPSQAATEAASDALDDLVLDGLAAAGVVGGCIIGLALTAGGIRLVVRLVREASKAAD